MKGRHEVNNKKGAYNQIYIFFLCLSVLAIYTHLCQVHTKVHTLYFVLQTSWLYFWGSHHLPPITTFSLSFLLPPFPSSSFSLSSYVCFAIWSLFILFAYPNQHTIDLKTLVSKHQTSRKEKFWTGFYLWGTGDSKAREGMCHFWNAPFLLYSIQFHVAHNLPNLFPFDIVDRTMFFFTATLSLLSVANLSSQQIINCPQLFYYHSSICSSFSPFMYNMP